VHSPSRPCGDEMGQELLERAGGVKIGPEAGAERFQIGGLLAGEEHGFRAEAVLEGVAAGGGLAGGGAGAGGLCGISTICGALLVGRHGSLRGGGSAAERGERRRRGRDGIGGRLCATAGGQADTGQGGDLCSGSRHAMAPFSGHSSARTGPDGMTPPAALPLRLCRRIVSYTHYVKK